MANLPSFDGIKCVATIPNGAAVSNQINVPKGAFTLTVFTPSALTTSTAWKLQTLLPSSSQSTTWADLKTFNQSATLVALSVTFGASEAVTFPSGVFGGGTLRIAVADNQGADRVFYCFFTQMSN